MRWGNETEHCVDGDHIIERLTDTERAELEAKLARGSVDIAAPRMVDASVVLAKLRARR